ncbi:hybrid sensor histidine kinase/response regulator [Taibaiella soli]|nr:response regulator [Taibaiella soli]
MLRTGKWAMNYSPVKVLEEAILLLKDIAKADLALIFRIDDNYTARSVYANPPRWNDLIVNPQPLRKLFHDSDADVYLLQDQRMLETLFSGSFNHIGSACLLYVNEENLQAVFFLGWEHNISVDEELQSFMTHARNRIAELLWQCELRISLDNTKVHFNAILDTIPQSVIFIDNTGKDGWVNPHAASMIGLDHPGPQKPEILAATMAGWRSKATNIDEINQRAMALFGMGVGVVKDWVWRFDEPQQHILNVSCVPINSAYLKGWLWVFEDITSMYLANEHLTDLNVKLHQETERADKENKAKSEFLANMSHEIRTPMNGVIGMASLLMNTTLDDEQKDFVDTIRLSGDTLLTLINDLLDFSKIESGGLELEQQPFVLRSVIEETFDLLSVAANKKQLDLLYLIEPDVPAEIVGDITRMRQILVNLVSNGIKFTEKGQVYISVQLNKRTPDGRVELEFKVQDSGIGIPADKFDRLFRNFSQVDASTTRRYGGTGLGLAISKRLVELMRGNIWVNSKEGVGTSFHFTVDVLQNNGPSVQVQEPLPLQELSTRKILVLDDNEINLLILKKQFEYWNIAIDTFATVPEAITAMQEKKYDIALIDLLMPVTDGIGTAKEIKANPKIAGVPLILFSSAYGFNHMTADDKAMFTAILDKPIKHSYLLKVMGKALGHTKASELITTSESRELKPMKINILIAEDNVINQKLITKVLQTMGYNADVVANGREAVEALERIPYDLILMDMQMPEMDGIEATREIRRIYDGDYRPLIIAMTASVYEEDKELCYAAGMDDYLLKPFKLDDVSEKFGKWAHLFTSSGSS